jgi:hypothetical protein
MSGCCSPWVAGSTAPISGRYRPMSTSRPGRSKRTCSMRRNLSCATAGRGPCSAHWRRACPSSWCPFFADQFENGRRVAGCGAGLVIEPEHEDANGPRRVIGDEDAPRIVDAINAVLGTASYGRNARRIALEMAAAPTVDQVLEALLGGRIEGMR